MKNQEKHMTTKEKQQLIKAQQGELDAVILYRRLAESIKETDYKEILLKIATDEGKHASILRKYTEENLKPKNLKARFISSIYKFFGLSFTLKILEKGEIKAAGEYASLVDKFPNIKEIIKDEEKHGKLMKKMYKYK